MPNPDTELFNAGQITYDELVRRGGGGVNTVREFLPIRYNDVQQSGLTAEVLPQTRNEINFDLTD